MISATGNCKYVAERNWLRSLMTPQGLIEVTQTARVNFLRREAWHVSRFITGSFPHNREFLAESSGCAGTSAPYNAYCDNVWDNGWLRSFVDAKKILLGKD